MFLLYSLAYALAAALLFPLEYGKRPAKLKDKWLAEKLGGASSAPPEGGGNQPGGGGGRPVLWVHAVSVGEVVAASYFISALMKRLPGSMVVLSTITDTGQKVAVDRLGGRAEIIYMPFDLPFALRRAISRLGPSVFVTMETEIWPNTFRAFRRAGIPVAVLNGRISERSYRGYRWIRGFIGRVLGFVDLFCMQDEDYAERIKDLGADARRVVVTGSFKFDIEVKEKPLSWASALGGPVIVAGSTHRGEEEVVLSAYGRLKADFEGLRLVIAPRHPERAEEVEGEIARQGFRCMRRSLMVEGEAASPGSVIVLDTVGELSSLYGHCDVAVIGGSFISGRGGQNFLEPAYWGKPVVCGPHMENFPFVEEFYSEGAALEADPSSLYNILGGLLASPDRRNDVGGRARALLDKNKGAVSKAVGALAPLIKR